MRKIKSIILAILAFVFCLQAREVVISYSYTTISYIDGAETAGRYEFEYDSEGNRTKATDYDADGNEKSRNEYEYDDNGNETKYTRYSGVNISLREREYNSNGKIIKEISYSNGKETSKFEYKYDFNGNETERLYYGSGSDKISLRYVYEYDSNGNRVKEIQYNHFYNPPSVQITIGFFEHDSNGNPPKTIYYNNNGTISAELKSEYDSNGKATKHIYYEGGSEIMRLEYAYDSKGNRTKSARYYTKTPEFNYYYEFVYEYNSQGDITKLISYSDGVKAYEANYYNYTYKTIAATAISGKQTTQTIHNFQISRSPNALNLNFADNSEKRVEIVNLQGRVLNSQSFSAKTRSVDISNLTRGVFVLRVFENGKVSSVRFVR